MSLRDRRTTIKSGSIGFAELADAYLAAKIGSMSTTDQDNTYRKLESVIMPRLGDLPALAINHGRLDRYVMGRLQDSIKSLSATERREIQGVGFRNPQFIESCR